MTELMELLRWAVCLFGLTYIVTEAAIFNKVREPIASKSAFLRRLMICPICFSLWGSLILLVIYFSPTGNLLTDALMGVGTYWLFNKASDD
jgi:hypothetical protein